MKAWDGRSGTEPQVGSETVGGSAIAPASSVTAVPVVFAAAFTSAPHVFVSLGSAPSGAARMVPRATEVTATGFDLLVVNVGTVDANFTGLVVHWQAVAA